MLQSFPKFQSPLIFNFVKTVHFQQRLQVYLFGQQIHESDFFRFSLNSFILEDSLKKMSTKQFLLITPERKQIPQYWTISRRIQSGVESHFQRIKQKLNQESVQVQLKKIPTNSNTVVERTHKLDLIRIRLTNQQLNIP